MNWSETPDIERLQMQQRDSIELYEAWLKTVRDHAHELALVDLHSGKQWTFQGAQQEVEKVELSKSGIEFPQGHAPEFIFHLLAAWRKGQITCPLEQGQARPVFEGLPGDCAHLKLTSASTGAAKCILFTAKQLKADALNIVSTMGLKPEAPNICVISMSHSYGFSNLVLPLVLHGIHLCIVPAPLPEMILRAGKETKEMTLAAVPALWRTWADSGAVPANVSIAISAGAPLPRELERFVYERYGIKIHNFYGSSECGGIAYDRSDTPRESENCVGTAMDHVHLSVTESGTLNVKSEAVGQSYWPERNESLKDGVFQTSDLAEIRDGCIYLRGRISDVINVAGRKASPEVIEQVLRTHPSVRECVVFGIEGPVSRFETIAACVNGPADAGDLIEFLTNKLPAWQIPRRWWFTNELQPNTRGKISRSEWRKKWMAHLQEGKGQG